MWGCEWFGGLLKVLWLLGRWLLDVGKVEERDWLGIIEWCYWRFGWLVLGKCLMLGKFWGCVFFCCLGFFEGFLFCFCCGGDGFCDCEVVVEEGLCWLWIKEFCCWVLGGLIVLMGILVLLLVKWIWWGGLRILWGWVGLVCGVVVVIDIGVGGIFINYE